MNIKICGITSPEDALLAAELGATHIGINFYPPSPRYVTAERANQIANSLQGLSVRPYLVGVFVNENSDYIRTTMTKHGLDLAQLSGNESEETLRELGDCAYKAYHLGEAPQISVNPPLTFHRSPEFLVDAYIPGQFGGTGKSCDWITAASISRRYNIFLAGGLNPENVMQAIQLVRPWGVDVASGIERIAGTKDEHKMREFVSNTIAATENNK